MTSLIITPQNEQEYMLLKEMLKRMQFSFKSIEIESIEDDESWYKFAEENFSRGYSENEPDYDDTILKEPNPEYRI